MGNALQPFVPTQSHALVETSSTAAAAQAKAMVEARYVIAMQRPRNWDQVRQDLIKECRRPSFAHNKSAWYVKPIGKGVEGLGIRFVEVALRCMTNVLIESTMIYEDTEKEVHRVSVTDLEANLTYPQDLRVSKTVERSKPADDGSYISVRKNSYNKDVYTIPANDDDLLNKRAALISKAVRTLGLRIIPGDMQDEAEAIIKSVRLDDAAKDPGAEQKRISDSFAGIGVKAVNLAAYLGHTLDTCSPAELVSLRGIYGAIKDGEATWQTVMDNKASLNAGDETQLRTYPEDQFAEALKKWAPLIKSGRKSAENIIATAQAKHPLSDAQKASIHAIKREEAPAAATPEQIADIRRRAEDFAISESDIFKKFNITTLDALAAAMVDPILAFIDNPLGE